MNDQGLARLWMVVAAGVTYLSINIWSYSQQWRIELPSIVTFNTEVGDNERITYAAAIYGMLLLGPPLLLLLCLSIAYARRKAQHPPALRIPRIGGLGVDPGTNTGRAIQCITAMVLLGVPIAAQAHFFRKFAAGTATKGNVSITGLDHFRFDVATAFDGSFRYDTVTYYPFIEAWLFLIMEMAVVLLTIATVYLLVRKTSPAGGIRPATRE